MNLTTYSTETSIGTFDIPVRGKNEACESISTGDKSLSSGKSTPDPNPPIIVNLNRSMTLAEFVQHIEQLSAKTVAMMYYLRGRHHHQMPVQAPQGNIDRYSGHGEELVEDVVFTIRGVPGHRQTIHGVYEFQVFYTDYTGGFFNYYF